MLAARIDAFHLLHQLGVQVAHVGQLAVIQLQINAGLDLFGQKVVGRYDQIEAGTPGQQFGVEYVIGVVDVVSHLNAGFFLEIGNSVFGNIVRPVIDIQLAVSLGGTHAT